VRERETEREKGGEEGKPDEKGRPGLAERGDRPSR